MFDEKSSLEKPQKCKSWEHNLYHHPYHPHREPSGRLTHGSCVWSPWNRSFHGALLSQCAFIVSSYTRPTPASQVWARKVFIYLPFSPTSDLLLGFAKEIECQKTAIFHIFVQLIFLVSSSWFSMVLMSASSKAPIKAFPCDGLFALKICRSNPETGHEINPMALSAHYKAFCSVMISLHVCHECWSTQSCLRYYSHQTLISWQQLRKQTSAPP